MYHNLIQIIFCSFTLMTLIIGIILLLFFSQRNRVQLLLVVILLFWAVPMPELLVEFINLHITSLPVGVLNIEELLRGYFGFSTLFVFPLSVLYWRIFKKKHILLFFLPIILTIVAYFWWHFATDTPWNVKYLTFSDLWAARFSITVILRMILTMWYVVYTLVILYIVWKLTPIYQKYSQDNYSNVAYNLNWIKGVAVLLGIHTIIWMLVLFFSEYMFVHVLFVISINTVFITLIATALFYKPFKSPCELNINWSWKRNWYLVEQIVDCKNHDKEILSKIDAWMKREKPFRDSDFYAQQVYIQFPELCDISLSTLLSEYNENFQTYVRRIRIEEACSIIRNTPDIRSGEVAYQVGFSSPATFNRAFLAVTGKNPSIFKEEIL